MMNDLLSHTVVQHRISDFTEKYEPGIKIWQWCLFLSNAQLCRLSPIWPVICKNIILPICCVHIKTRWTVITYLRWNDIDLHMQRSIECSFQFPMTIGSSGPVTSLRGCYIILLGEIELFDFIFKNHLHDWLYDYKHDKWHAHTWGYFNNGMNYDIITICNDYYQRDYCQII